MVKEFQEKIETIKIEFEERNRETNAPEINEYLDPPDSVTNISILPSLDKINREQKPFLRKSLTSGAYINVYNAYINAEHYVDTQFRLLREDFLQPLRKRLIELKNSGRNAQREKYFTEGK